MIDFGVGFVGIGVGRCAFDANPRADDGIPADYAVHNTRMILQHGVFKYDRVTYTDAWTHGYAKTYRHIRANLYINCFSMSNANVNNRKFNVFVTTIKKLEGNLPRQLDQLWLIDG